MRSKHRVLVIGVGSIGERHLRCFGNTGRTEMSFCEVNAELRQTIAERYQIEKHYADLEAAMQDEHDVAVIAAPAPFHVPMAIQLVETGVHVMSEKPLSTSLDRVDELLQLVEAKGVTTGVGYTWRSHPTAFAVKQELDTGRFGQPRQVIAVCGQHFPTYRPAYRDVYFAKRETGGGAIQDAMTHMLNLGQWLAGRIDSLAADAAHLVLDGVEVEDTVHVITRQGDVMGTYVLNMYQAPSETAVTIVCDQATVRLEAHKFRWRWMGEPDSQWHDTDLPKQERDAMYISQANSFLDAVEDKGAVRCTLEEAMWTLRVNLAALEAADTHTWQNVEYE